MQCTFHILFEVCLIRVGVDEMDIPVGVDEMDIYIYIYIYIYQLPFSQKRKRTHRLDNGMILIYLHLMNKDWHKKERHQVSLIFPFPEEKEEIIYYSFSLSYSVTHFRWSTVPAVPNLVVTHFIPEQDRC